MTVHAEEDVGQGKYSFIAWGNTNCTTTLEINLAVYQKLRIGLPQDPVTLLINVYPNDTLPYHKHVHSSFVHNSQK